MPLVFNGVTRQIEVTDVSIVSLDVEKDIYSEWKRWSQIGDNSKYASAFFSFGGNGTAPGQLAPKYFFLQNFWQMKIDNGNIVSIGLNLYTQDFVTPYIVVAGSGVSDRNSDAVSVNSADIEFASYQGGVTIDVANITGRAGAGTTFPFGTERQPVNNLVDAKTIADNLGLTHVFVIGDLTLDLTADFSRFEFRGESVIKTTITINPAATVLNCEFYDCTLAGALDGSSHIERSVIGGIDFVDGYIFNCALGPGITKLGTGTTANMFNCYSTVPGSSTPEIDMSGTGVLALRNYNGGILLKNYTGTGSHSVDLSSGQVKLDSTTITSGIFVVRGEGKLVDENGVRILSGTWNGGVTIINETSDVRTNEILVTKQYSKKASDNAEQVNLKIS